MIRHNDTGRQEFRQMIKELSIQFAGNSKLKIYAGQGKNEKGGFSLKQKRKP